MFYRFFRVVSAIAIIVSLSIPASAQDALPGDNAYYFYGLRILLVGIALVLAIHYARTAFEAPIGTPEDGPAPPRYMTQPQQYRLGMIAYIGLCLAAYALIVGYYKDLAPFVEIAAPGEVRPIIDTAVRENAMSFPVVVVLGLAAVVALLKFEHEWNPLFALRRLVWGWISIPQLSDQIMNAALNDLIVPEKARKAVVSDPKNHVDIGDFEKDRVNLDRKWGELCYVRLWLTRNLDEGSHNTFFNEPRFFWQKLESDFDTMRDRITRIKQTPRPEDPIDREVFNKIVGMAETLRRKYCRLAALFMLFKNATKKGVVSDAAGFGVKIAADEARANPMRYIVMFLLAIVASIYLGVWLSATLWDLVHPTTGGAAAASSVAGNGAVATTWVYYGLASFGAPIAAALMLRFATWKYDAEQPDSYPTSYAVIVAVALCVSVASLAVATRLGHGVHAHDPWIDLISRDFKWGWAPALICVYIVYHIDRQIDPLLPDIGKLGGEGVPHRILACFSFAIFVTLLSALPTASLEVQPDSPWPIEKLRFVVIGTIFALGFVTALVSQFCLVKPRRGASRGADVTSPALHAP
jgi:hypothetical protein